MGTIIYLIGLVLSIMAVLDIFKKDLNLGWKIVWSIVVLATSWVGLIVYYLLLKDNIVKWCK
ncbi:MAG: PLDc N-terminal domain-containing protein [Bacteroidales bacterium]